MGHRRQHRGTPRGRSRLAFEEILFVQSFTGARTRSRVKEEGASPSEQAESLAPAKQCCRQVRTRRPERARDFRRTCAVKGECIGCCRVTSAAERQSSRLCVRFSRWRTGIGCVHGGHGAPRRAARANVHDLSRALGSRFSSRVAEGKASRAAGLSESGSMWLSGPWPLENARFRKVGFVTIDEQHRFGWSSGRPSLPRARRRSSLSATPSAVPGTYQLRGPRNQPSTNVRRDGAHKYGAPHRFGARSRSSVRQRPETAKGARRH